MKDCYAIILAAGKGTGMITNNQEFSKVSYRILGKPLINFVLDAAKPLINRDMYVVVGHGGNSTIRCVGNDAKIVWQKEILGTGHAVKLGADELKDVEGDVFIINGDTPLLTTETLKKLYNKHQKAGDKLTICTCVLENPKKYGRIIRELPSDVKFHDGILLFDKISSPNGDLTAVYNICEKLPEDSLILFLVQTTNDEIFGGIMKQNILFYEDGKYRIPPVSYLFTVSPETNVYAPKDKIHNEIACFEPGALRFGFGENGPAISIDSELKVGWTEKETCVPRI